MATQPEPYDIEDEAEDTTESAPLSLLDAMQANNIVPLMDEHDVARIGGEALQEYQIDLKSCDKFHERYDRAMKIAMQEPDEKTWPWPKASNIIFPILTQAAIQFQARAAPAIMDGQNVVKAKPIGEDPEGKKRQRAERVASHMSWQFMYDVPGWQDDTDKLLLQLPVVGCMFRKTWRDTLRDQNNSETVTAKDLIVNYSTPSFEKAPRFTHRQRYYPHEIETFIRSGQWAKIPYDGEDGSDPHSLVEIYEQFRLIDLDDDGMPEPYVVTLTKDGNVARIVACFDQSGVYLKVPMSDQQVTLADLMGMGPEVLGQGVEVIRIERREYFTKYGFIPSPDGSFYDMGFGTLTEHLGAAINATINQMIDAGTLANLQGGFISGTAKIKGGPMRITPGEWKPVLGVTAGPLKDSIMPLNLPGPSSVLFQLLGLLIDAVQGITSVSDILTGNQESQTAPTTALALIEEGQKVFTAIYGRIHRALACEIKIMAGLNRDYLDQQKYTDFNDNPQAIAREDYNDADLDIVPFSDPRSINDRARMAKAQVLMAHNGDPLVNQIEIRKREFEAAGIDNIEALLKVPEPPPDPKALAEVAKLSQDGDKTEAEIRAKDAETVKTLIEAATAAYSLGAAIGDAVTQQGAHALLTEAFALAQGIHAELEAKHGGGEPADREGGVPGMEGPPADAGIPGLPEAPAGPMDGVVDNGAGDSLAPSGAGGGIGPAAEPVLQ